MRALVRDPARARRSLPQAARVIGDITRPDTLAAAVEGDDAIVFTHGSSGGGKAEAQETRPRAAPPAVYEVAPGLGHFTDDVLFGEVWPDAALASRDRSLITVSAIVSTGKTAQIAGHVRRALDNGVKPEEDGKLITQLAFYSGWPNAISAVAETKKVFDERQIGPVTDSTAARTAWHTHPLGQTLFILSGRGWVQKEVGPIIEVSPGDVVWIPPNLRHWHGASAGQAMSHFVVAEALDGSVVTWLEQVSEARYRAGPGEK